MPELHELPPNEIAAHVQASNLPADGNKQYCSSFVAYDDLEFAIHPPCQERVKGYYNRFYKADGFLLASATIITSLNSMGLQPADLDDAQINSFEKFLQLAAFTLENTCRD